MTDTTTVMLAHLAARTAELEADGITMPNADASIRELMTAMKSASEKQGRIAELRLMSACLSAANRLAMLANPDPKVCFKCGEKEPCACEPATQGKVW